MLFKELQTARRKYLLVLFGYGLVGLAIITMLNPAHSGGVNSIFHSWAAGALFLTIGAAILVGSDSISEETGKNTISFLLTRPVSRANIYAVKYLINAFFLGATLLTTSVIMFLFEQQQQSYWMFWSGPNGETLSSLFVVDTMSADEAFTNITVILGVGLAVLALTTFISIFSHSAINTIVFTILTGLGLMVIYGLGDLFFSIHHPVNSLFDLKNGLGLGDFVVLLALTAGIYLAGLKIFKAREF